MILLENKLYISKKHFYHQIDCDTLSIDKMPKESEEIMSVNQSHYSVISHHLSFS